MILDIKVDTQQRGNPQRGYHAYSTTVTLGYRGTSCYTEQKEHKIVEAIVGTREDWMWYSLKREHPHGNFVVYTIDYGYDSGD